MEYLTAKQVAEKYNVKIKTVRKHIDREHFLSVRGDGQIKMGAGRTDIWMIHQEAAERMYGGRSNQKQAPS